VNPPKILIVDDEPFNVDYLEQELEGLEYETLAAFDGQEALDTVGAEAPDLVLLDIMMPVMDGFEVLRRLKADPATREIPVIVISASSDLRSVAKGIQLGAEDYLPKPFEPVLLHARIASCLEKKRLRDLQQLYLKSLEHELEIGREIQMEFLPSELPKADGWEIGAYFKAAREVAGDFYDAFLLPDGNLACVIGDVCDKGVGAALFMTLFRSLIRASSTTDAFYIRSDPETLTPAERLRHVVSFTNDYVADTHGDAVMFATVFIGIFNLQDGTLTYVNAGNDPPLLLGKAGVLEKLPRTGPAIGVISGAEFSIKQTTVAKDSLFLAFTDGIPDALNVDDESFGNERLLNSISGSDQSAAELLKNIETQLNLFIGEADQFDDITLLAVKRGSEEKL
jgi:sigma-B regulation protein RsbU (phosphoserine phosphatase)